MSGLGSTTSTSTVQLSIGPKTFTVVNPSVFQAGQSIRALYDQTHYLDGTITQISGRVLTVNTTNVVGSGIYARWTLTVNDQPSIGSTGATGPEGPFGPTGPRGLPGATGTRGFTGSAGAAAAMGATGVQGPRGSTGVMGATGIVGFTGSRGNNGFVGSIGIGFVGSRGVNGFTGSVGSGFTGSAGVNGFTGSGGQGFTGSQGLIGASGATGVMGATGPSGGYTGSAGSTGLPGTPGFTGSEGLRGVPGLNGATGIRGFTGSVGAGFTGSAGLAGVTGFTGSVGPSGTISGNVSSSLIPTADITYNLGSPSRRWKELYLSSNTLYLGNVSVTPTAAGLAISEPIEGGENLAIGMYFVQWTNTQKLKIRTSTTSDFNEIFTTLKRNDSFELITGSIGNFPAGTVLTATGPATKVSGGVAPGTYFDWTIPIDINGTNQYVYKFFLTRTPATDLSELNDSTGLLSNLSSNASSLTSGNISGNLIPSTDVTYNLGSPTRRWRELYLSSNTLYLGNVAVTPTASGLATTQPIEGGEGIGGIAFVQWTSGQELKIRAQTISTFIPTFQNLKRGDTFELLTGLIGGVAGGTFPPDTILTVTGTVTRTGGGAPSVFNYYDWTIPVDIAGTGQYVYRFLLTSVPATDISQLNDSTGLLAQSTGGNVSGLASRTVANVTTPSIATNANANVTVTGFKGYYLYKVQVSRPAWVRIYTSTAARGADLSRSRDVDPVPDAGVIAEVITTTANQTVTLSPAVIGFNDDNPVTDQIPMYVTNLDGSTGAVTVNLTIVKTEA